MRINGIKFRIVLNHFFFYFLSLLVFLPLYLSTSFPLVTAPAYAQTIDILKLNNDVGVHVGAKINKNGDVVWKTIDSGVTTLNFFNKNSGAISIIASTDKSVGDYNFNDLGDVVWEIRERVPNGGSYINFYSVYYKAYDSQTITFLGESKAKNLSNTPSAYPTLPRINNNRLIVTRGLIANEDMAITQIPGTSLTPITQNLSNVFYRVGFVEINDNNVFAYNLATNSPHYTVGDARIFQYTGIAPSLFFRLWGPDPAYPYSGDLTKNNTYFYTSTSAPVDLRKVVCLQGNCQSTIIGPPVTGLNANDSGHAVWYNSSNVVQYYDGLNIYSVSNPSILASGARIGGNNEIVWYESGNTAKLIWHDTNTNNEHTLFETNPGERIIELEISEAGDTVLTIYNETTTYRDIYLIRKPVFNASPTAVAGSDKTAFEGTNVTFDGSASTDPDGQQDITSYSWNFGDGNTGSGVIVNHTYADNGVYIATLTVTDTAGASSTDSTTITINNIAPSVGEITAPLDPVQVNTSITASAGFTDPGILDTHTAVWNWGDGATSSGTVTESGGNGSVTGSHTYSTPGVYTLTLTVTDKDGGFSTTTFQYIVIYNPGGGFVTGGGWIDNGSGKVNFGFNSKYENGATIPTGQTQLNFKLADFNFNSTSYEWLVVSGPKAQYKGSGTVNGTGDYSFILTTNDQPDKFRLKVWDKITGNVLYDSQPGDADDADASTVLGGGNIIIHN